jgi:flagellar motor switch protein FliG
MDVFKTANKVVAAALQQKQLENEENVLAGLRAEAMSLRAQIGEEMFKLWKARQIPPSWLDELFEHLDSTNLAIVRQREILAQLREGGAAGEDMPADLPESPPSLQVIEEE